MAKVPALTRSAQKISACVASLDDDGQRRAVHTVRSLVEGIRGLGSLPDEITNELWSVIVTIARKSILGGRPEAFFAELQAGLSPELAGLIQSEAQR